MGSFSHAFFSGLPLENHRRQELRWQTKLAKGWHSPSFSHVDVLDLLTESGSASKRWGELRPQPTAEATNTCAYKFASTVIRFVLATAESAESSVNASGRASSVNLQQRKSFSVRLTQERRGCRRPVRVEKLTAGKNGKTYLRYPPCLTAPFNFSLAGPERLIHRHLAGQGGGDILTNLQADGLELGYADELYPDVRHVLNRGVCWVGCLHRLEGYRSKGCRFLVLRVVVSRFPRAGRYRGPTSIFRCRLDVLLRSAQ